MTPMRQLALPLTARPAPPAPRGVPRPAPGAGRFSSCGVAARAATSCACSTTARCASRCRGGAASARRARSSSRRRRGSRAQRAPAGRGARSAMARRRRGAGQRRGVAAGGRGDGPAGGVRCAGELVGTPPPGDDLRPMVERWLRARAVRELPGELLALARPHGIAVTRVSVRNQQSRWGSCSRARDDLAQLAAGPGAAVRARVRARARADAPPRAEPLGPLLAPCRGGVSPLRRGTALAAASTALGCSEAEAGQLGRAGGVAGWVAKPLRVIAPQSDRPRRYFTSPRSRQYTVSCR